MGWTHGLGPGEQLNRGPQIAMGSSLAQPLSHDREEIPEMAKRGNNRAWFGASFVTIDEPNVLSYPWLVPGLADGQGCELPLLRGSVAFIGAGRS